MAEVVKEALRASCIHKDVCKFSDTYLELTDLINRSIANTVNSKVIANTLNSKVKDKYDFIEIQDPKCTYFLDTLMKERGWQHLTFKKNDH